MFVFSEISLISGPLCIWGSVSFPFITLNNGYNMMGKSLKFHIAKLFEGNSSDILKKRERRQTVGPLIS